MKSNGTRAVLGKRSDLRWINMLALIGTTMLYRYRGSGGLGPLLLFVPILDVLVYAVALSLVVESVFQLQESDRFVPMLIGMVALRWSLGCALQASRVANFTAICRPYFRHPLLATMLLALGPPTFFFLIATVFLGFTIVLTVHAPIGIFHMLGWGLFVVLVQMSWNSLLVLAIISMRSYRILTSEVPIVFSFVLVLIISPVAYQFEDIPEAASRILTSYNPVSHLIAAYHNSFWYMRDVSFEVLPFSAIVASALVLLILILTRRQVGFDVEREEASPIFMIWEGQGWTQASVSHASKNTHIYRAWPNELPWITGQNFLRLIEALGATNVGAQVLLRKLVGEREADRMLKTQLPFLSSKNRAWLCMVPVLSKLLCETSKQSNVMDLSDSVPSPIILDELCDYANEQDLKNFSEIVALAGAGRIAVKTYQQRVARILEEYCPKNVSAIEVI